MKKLILFLLVVHTSMITNHCISQPCLPEGINFTTQEEIDSFQSNYPNCTEIGGSVVISGLDISNLNELNVLTSIEGQLLIYNNEELESLSGLDNLIFIGGNLKIGTISGAGGTPWGNHSLTDISALSSLQSIAGDLLILDNPLLQSLYGLHNIDIVVGDIKIRENHSLTNLTGLNSIGTIQGSLLIFGNQSLENLTGLENLVIIEETVYIGTLGNDDPNPYENPSLTSLEGLNNLISVEGDLRLAGNDVLENLDGLGNLISIGGQLKIAGNTSLNSIEGFQNLIFVETGIDIWNNDNLTSLSGLDNVNPATMIFLEIMHNDILTNCEIQSICNYLYNYNGSINISANSSGCNNQEEVEEACETVLINEHSISITYSISPNPIESAGNIKYTLAQLSNVILQIHDLNGREILIIVNEHQNKGEHNIGFDASFLKPGIYFCTLKTNEGIQTGKIVKM